MTGYRQIGKQYEGLVSSCTTESIVRSHFPPLSALQMHSLNTDFIVPLETKVEAEEANLTVRVIKAEPICETWNGNVILVYLYTCHDYMLILIFRACAKLTSKRI